MNLLSKFVTKGKKNGFRDWMIIAVICGLFLLMLFFPVGDRGEANGDLSLMDLTSTGGADRNEHTDEIRLEELLGKIENVGKVDVMITYEKKAGFYETQSDKIAGIVVVCEKDCNSESVLLIHEVIQALFPVSAHKIKVVKGIAS